MSTMICTAPWYVNEGTSLTLLGRLLGHDGAAMAKADVTSIGWAIYDVNDSASAVIADTPAIVVDDVMYDALQTADARWTVDSTGFNFAWPAPATIVPDGGKTYHVQLTVTPASGGVIIELYELKTREVYGA